mmetsp:Transcript_22655/g.54218  ORF Transcript_22655/g.54218 Transcript_22655/m.54218 type:complete len:264 (-) Transcript_22655:790-1581(-)
MNKQATGAVGTNGSTASPNSAWILSKCSLRLLPSRQNSQREAPAAPFMPSAHAAPSSTFPLVEASSRFRGGTAAGDCGSSCASRTALSTRCRRHSPTASWMAPCRWCASIRAWSPGPLDRGLSSLRSSCAVCGRTSSCVTLGPSAASPTTAPYWVLMGLRGLIRALWSCFVTRDCRLGYDSPNRRQIMAVRSAASRLSCQWLARRPSLPPSRCATRHVRTAGMSLSRYCSKPMWLLLKRHLVALRRTESMERSLRLSATFSVM